MTSYVSVHIKRFCLLLSASLIIINHLIIEIPNVTGNVKSASIICLNVNYLKYSSVVGALGSVKHDVSVSKENSPWVWYNLITTCQVFGLMTKPLIRFLLPVSPPPKRKNSLANMEASNNPPKSITVPFLGGSHDSENELDGNEDHRPSTIRALLSTSTHNVHRLWRNFDISIMRPVFGGRGFAPAAPPSPTEGSGIIEQWH